MKYPFKFNPEKALQAILYVAERIPREDNLYAVLKVIYFADKEHLHRFGRLIFGDRYVAMSHGPVPSGAYDLVKYVRGDGWDLNFERARASFAVEADKNIQLFASANTEAFSESDLQCLDEAIAKYGKLSFGELKRLSHDDPAYKAADPNDVISIDAMAKSLPDGEKLAAYLKDPNPG